MKEKNRIIGIVIIILFLELILNPITIGGQEIYVDKNILKEDNENPWSAEDEGSHFPYGCEWWWLYVVLILDDGTHWDMCIQFAYQANWTGKYWSETDGLCYVRIQSWNRETDEFFDCYHLKNDLKTLKQKKNTVDLKFFNSTMTGLFPNYNAYLDDDINNIQLDVDFHAVNNPHWVGQDSVGGVIPFKTTSMCYGIIPRGKINGILTINDTSFKVTGIGYYEHFFADSHLYDSNCPKFRSLKEQFNIGLQYSKLAKWFYLENIRNKKERMDSFHWSTDDLLGYDWIWMTFENNWSAILYKVMVAGKVEGGCIGILLLTDGKTYWEFGNVNIKIRRQQYLKDIDMYIPLDFEITSYKDDKEIYILFESTSKMAVQLLHSSKMTVGNFGVAGKASGFFKDDMNNEILTGGVGTNTPLRLIHGLKHRSIKIDILLPPEGIGITIRQISHRTKRELFYKFQLRPTFDFDFYIRPIVNDIKDEIRYLAQ